MKTQHKILIVEPSDIILEGLAQILNGAGIFSVLPALHDTVNLTDRITVLKPDIIIINPTLEQPEYDISKDIPRLALVYQYVEPAVIQKYDGVIDIRENKSRIVAMMREATENHASETGMETENYELSTREIEVLIEIANGLSSKEIANKLNISVHTVNTHRKNITHKTGIKSLAGLGVYAMLHDLMK